MSKLIELYKQSSSYYISLYGINEKGESVSHDVGFTDSIKTIHDEVFSFSMRNHSKEVVILLGENFSDGWPHEVKVNVQIKYELTEL